MNLPNWLWFLVAVLIILAILWLIGLPIHIGR